jgi:hypothetical protein
MIKPCRTPLSLAIVAGLSVTCSQAVIARQDSETDVSTPVFTTSLDNDNTESDESSGNNDLRELERVRKGSPNSRGGRTGSFNPGRRRPTADRTDGPQTNRTHGRRQEEGDADTKRRNENIPGRSIHGKRGPHDPRDMKDSSDGHHGKPGPSHMARGSRQRGAGEGRGSERHSGQSFSSRDRQGPPSHRSAMSRGSRGPQRSGFAQGKGRSSRNGRIFSTRDQTWPPSHRPGISRGSRGLQRSRFGHGPGGHSGRVFSSHHRQGPPTHNPGTQPRHEPQLIETPPWWPRCESRRRPSKQASVLAWSWQQKFSVTWPEQTPPQIDHPLRICSVAVFVAEQIQMDCLTRLSAFASLAWVIFPSAPASRPAREYCDR